MMENRSGIRSSVLREFSWVPIVAFLLVGGLAGCGEDGPDEQGSEANGGQTREVVEAEGDLPGGDAGRPPGDDRGQDRPNHDGTADTATPDDRPGPGAGTRGQGGIAVLEESQLTGVGAGLPGRIGVAVSAPGGPGPVAMVGDLTTGPAGSTINLPIAEQILRGDSGTAAARSQVRARIGTAISQPDAEATESLFLILESSEGGRKSALGKVRRSLGANGAAAPAPSPSGSGSVPPGQLLWPLGAQSRYMASIAGGCLGSSSTRRFLLSRMAPADGREGYGLGSAGRGARWTGGIGQGPNGRLVARQIGTLGTGAGRVVVAMLAIPYDGSPETAREMLNELTDRLGSRFADRSFPKRPCPGSRTRSP
jgi:hypothetical protein